MRNAHRALSSIAFGLLAVAISGFAGPQAQAQVPNIPYGPKPYQLFDWYPPFAVGGNPVTNAPWVLYVHGSGSNKEDVADVGQIPLAELFRHNGFAVFAFNWPNYSTAVYPAQLDDAIAATQFLRANAATYDIDPDRMVLWGHSAGATIGGWLAFGPDHSDPQGSAQDQQSTRPTAFLNWRGLMDFTAMKPSFPGTGFGAVTLSQLTPTFLDLVSPTFLLSTVPRTHTPPVASYYGTNFSLLPLSNPHDPWFMNNLHQTLASVDPATWALSMKLQNPDFPAVDPTQMEMMTTWAMDRVGTASPLNLGHAIKGKSGFPLLKVSGDTGSGGSVSIQMQSAIKTTHSVLLMVLGTQRKDVPFLNGSLVTKPLLTTTLTTDSTGALTIPATIPPGAQGTAYLQFLHADDAAEFGTAASNGVRVDFGG